MDLSTAVPVKWREDGLLEKDTFDLSSATPLNLTFPESELGLSSNIPQLSQARNPKYSPPPTEEQKAQALVELSYAEKGKKVPIGIKADWMITSPTAQMITKNVLGGILTYGIVPAYNALKGIANAESPDSDIGKMIFDSAYKGLAETSKVDNLGGAAAKAYPNVPWQITGTMGAVAETLMFMPSVVKGVAKFLSPENQLTIAFNNFRNSPKWGDFISNISSKVSQPIEIVEQQIVRDFYASRADMAKSGNYFKVLNKNLTNATGIDLASEVGSISPRVGQKVSFTDSKGIVKAGKITALEGERVTIDMNGREVITTLSQLSIPAEDLLPKETSLTASEAVARGMTAEEWVASKGTAVHHGTGVEFEGKPTPNKQGNIYFTDSFDYAEKYAQNPDFSNIYSGVLDVKKTADLSNLGVKKYSSKTISKKLNELRIKVNDKKLAEDAGDYASEFWWYVRKSPEINRALKEAGYDSAKFIEERHPGESRNSWIIFDKSKFKTQDELLSEFEKAKGEAPPAKFRPTKNKGMLGNQSGQVNTGMDDAEEFVTKALVPLSTRLSKISEPLKHAVRKYEFDIATQNMKDTEAILPLLNATKKMSKADLDSLDMALKNASPLDIDPIISRYGIQKEYQAVRKVLDDIYTRAKDAGMDLKYLDTYFPRTVEDLEGLLSYFKGSNQWSMFTRAFDKEAGAIGRPLTDDEKGQIISKMMRGYGGEYKVTFGSAGHTKERTVSQITPDINKFYKSAIISLIDYINGMNTNIAARVFFGKGKNLDISIGNYVSKLIDQGIIDISNEKELTDIIKSLFKAKGTHGIVSGFKNFSYMASMGSPISAITQIQDLAFSLYRNGYYNTWMGATHKVFTKKDMAIDRIAEEFTDPSKSSKALNKLFKIIGLEGMDKFGKETMINGAWVRLQKQASDNNPEFIQMLKDAFGDKKYQSVLSDFQQGNTSDDVKYILFSELADFQPIALSEMPEYYVSGGNMRVFYMLKSYTIKQIDAFHNEVFRGMKKNPAKSLGNLIRLATALAVLGVTADTIKDLMLGRKTKLQDLVIDNILRIVGFSKWQLYKTREDGFFDTLLSSIIPPIPFVDDLWKDAISTVEGKKPIGKLRIWQRIPIIGKYYYWWFGGGRDLKYKTIKISGD